MFALKKLMTAAVLSVAALHAGAVTLSFTSAPGAGSGTDVDVRIVDATDLYAYQFSVAFDPRVLRANGVRTGPFLDMGGNTYGDPGVLDNDAGTISFAFNTLLNAPAGVTGSGSLLNIHFDAVSDGISFLRFGDLLFLDSALNDISVTAVDANVSTVPEPSPLMLLGIGIVALVLRRRGEKMTRSA